MDGVGNDPDHGRPSGESHPSRRTFLGAASALGVAGAAFQLLPAGAARASAVIRAGEARDAVREAAQSAQTAPMAFAGADRGAFAVMLNGGTVNGVNVPPLATPPTAVRWYIDEKTYPNTTPGYYSSPPPNGVGGWPDLSGAPYNTTAHALVSIRPDITMLLNHEFDDDLIDFMGSAPGGPASLLTMWHEVATDAFSNPNYPKIADAPAFVEALSYLQQLASGTDVKVGAVNVNPSALMMKNYPSGTTHQEVYNTWMAACLDWYGCDLYDNASYSLSPYDELNEFQTCANSLPGSGENANWPINIPEINSPVDNASGLNPPPSTIKTSGPTGFRRSDFFNYAWSWIENVAPASHSTGLLGFWNGPGNEGSPWPPTDDPAGSQQAMIDELNRENGFSAP